jgi:uncharacterized protein YlxP (DUF503 family)
MVDDPVVGPWAAVCTGIISGTVALVTLFRGGTSKTIMDTQKQDLTHLIAAIDKLIDGQQKLAIGFAEISRDQEHQRDRIDDMKAKLEAYHHDLKMVRDVYHTTMAKWIKNDREKEGLSN